FLEADARGLEGVGLDHVGPGLEVRDVDLLHHVGAGEAQVVVAALPALAPEIVGAEPPRLDLGAHGAVVHQHALAKGGEKTAFHGENALLPRTGTRGVPAGPE